MRNTVVIAFLILTCCIPGYSVEIPSSKRSKEVIKRLSPILEKAMKGKSLNLGAPIFIRIIKASRKLEVWVKSKEKYALFKTYPILAFSGYLGPKLREGDNQAPEGFYYVTASRMNPNSKFHLSFNLGYPNAYDRKHKRTGSALMVHGNKVSIGCYAMGDKGIEEIYTLAHVALAKGQKYFRVHIFPFSMTNVTMLKYENSKWYSFWNNLKEGYDWFEKHKQPPNVSVHGLQYTFEQSK